MPPRDQMMHLDSARCGYRRSSMSRSWHGTLAARKQFAAPVRVRCAGSATRRNYLLTLTTTARKLKVTLVIDAAPFVKLGVPLENAPSRTALTVAWAVARSPPTLQPNLSPRRFCVPRYRSRVPLVPEFYCVTFVSPPQENHGLIVLSKTDQQAVLDFLRSL
jgi:hypothetical protein